MQYSPAHHTRYVYVYVYVYVYGSNDNDHIETTHEAVHVVSSKKHLGKDERMICTLYRINHTQ